jgi:hypothetical protein
MPGFNQQALNYKVRNANGVAIFVGDQLVGFGQSSTPNIDFGLEAIYAVGDNKPQELQQLKAAMSLSLDSFVLTEEGQAFFGITTPWSDILSNNQFNIVIQDAAGNALKTYVGWVAGSVSTSISANQPLTEAISGQAMDVLDRQGKSVLASNSAAVFNAIASSAGGLLNTAGI